ACSRRQALHPIFMLAYRFSYTIPIALGFSSSRFFMAVCPLIGCDRMFKKRVTQDGCHVVRPEPWGAPARTARADSSRPDDDGPSDGPGDRADVRALAGPA